MKNCPDINDYFLEVVKDGEEPKFPKSKEELVVGSQPLENNFVQYWAYPKSWDKSENELPPAEITAAEHPTSKPAVLIDQPPIDESNPEQVLELILVKDSHAWAKTVSSVENLEDNLSSILDFAEQKLNIKVEHFMTTSKVSREVDAKLDDLEEAEGQEKLPVKEAKEKETEQITESQGIRSITPGRQVPTSGIYTTSSFSVEKKITLLVAVIVVVIMVLGVIFYRKEVFIKFAALTASFSGQSVQITPTVVPTPTEKPMLTPTPAVERGDYKIRVLNGTMRTGAASSLADKLKELGWQISKTGNATDQATIQTIVRVKKGSETAGSLLITDLLPDLKATTSAVLEKADKADAEVVIGKE